MLGKGPHRKGKKTRRKGKKGVKKTYLIKGSDAPENPGERGCVWSAAAEGLKSRGNPTKKKKHNPPTPPPKEKKKPKTPLPKFTHPAGLLLKRKIKIIGG